MRLIERLTEAKAERDRYMAEASERQREIGRLEAERDALLRWQAEAVPYLMAYLRDMFPNVTSIAETTLRRLITEAEGRRTT
jgi:hypothetical protein